MHEFTNFDGYMPIQTNTVYLSELSLQALPPPVSPIFGSCTFIGLTSNSHGPLAGAGSPNVGPHQRADRARPALLNIPPAESCWDIRYSTIVWIYLMVLDGFLDLILRIQVVDQAMSYPNSLLPPSRPQR